jgi:DNA invertase Pin-like site-specific DNA recombinase
MAQIGYARVSTPQQDEAAQVKALKDAGCDEVYSERISTRVPESQREQLQAALSRLTKGDVLVVPKLDRLGRTQVEVINRLHQLQSEGIHIRTLDGLINTEGLGKFAPVVIGMLTGIAEVERSLIQERILDSIAHRKATGGDLGGRRKSFKPEQVEMAQELKRQGKSVREIGKAIGLSKSVVGRLLT